MSRDYKHAAKESAPRKRAPCWLWLVTGLAIGLFVAFLTYLTVSAPQSMHRASAGAPSQQERPPSAPRKSSKASTPETQPRFEFYTILPEREVRVPEHELRPAARKSSEPARYVLQVGSFRKIEEADRLKAQLALIGLEAEIQGVSINGNDTWHRVRLGPYASLRQLKDARSRLQQNGFEGLVLKEKD